MRPNKRIVLLVNDVFSSYQAGFRAAIERAAHRRNTNVIVLMGRELVHPDLNERAQNVIYDWATPDLADGAIVLSGTIANFCGPVGIAALLQRIGRMPLVSIGLSVPGHASIALENESSQSIAVEHLIKHHGRTRIAYIAGPPASQEACSRLQGYRDALRNNGLVADDRLIAAGHFTLPSGERAIRELLARGPGLFDSVVVANDHMALGAMNALGRMGVRIPEDMLVVGFDDTPIARFATRSLTTIAQPIDQMAEAAVAELLHRIEGGEKPARSSFEAQLVLRESCGCGYERSRPVHASDVSNTRPTDYLSGRRDEIAKAVQPPDWWSSGWRTNWIPGLVDALTADLGGQVGELARYLEHSAEAASAEHSSLEEIGRVVLALQRHMDGAGYRGASHFDLEQLWMIARNVVSAAISRKEARAALDQLERSAELRHVTQRLSLAFERRSLAAELERSLPSLGVDTAYVALQSPTNPRSLRPLLAVERGEKADVGVEAHAPHQLLPRGFPAGGPWSLLVWAVTFESEVLGILALGGNAEPLVGEAVRAQIGAALRMGELHARVVEQAALQERMGREQWTQEMAIARRIQTALAPKDLRARALDIAATTAPADLVGGDYFDVLNVDGGCWLAIGDVAGHGLMSGLVMLTIQSIVSTLVMSRPDATPAELTIALNRILFPHLRERLQRHEHATFLLLHVSDDGRLRFAGEHEDLIIWRSRSRRCDLVSTTGTWLGLVEDIQPVTVDAELDLVPGDLLVLVTDGMIEARNAKNEHFGIESIRTIVQGHADWSPQAILDELVAATRAWAPVQQDDVTCLVARFTGRSR